jgi:hypothetical protein
MNYEGCGGVLTYPVSMQGVVAIAQHPTAPFVFSAALDGVLRQWDIRTGVNEPSHHAICMSDLLNVAAVAVHPRCYTEAQICFHSPKSRFAHCWPAPVHCRAVCAVVDRACRRYTGAGAKPRRPNGADRIR